MWIYGQTRTLSKFVFYRASSILCQNARRNECDRCSFKAMRSWWEKVKRSTMAAHKRKLPVHICTYMCVRNACMYIVKHFSDVSFTRWAFLDDQFTRYLLISYFWNEEKENPSQQRPKKRDTIAQFPRDKMREISFEKCATMKTEKFYHSKVVLTGVHTTNRTSHHLTAP